MSQDHEGNLLTSTVLTMDPAVTDSPSPDMQLVPENKDTSERTDASSKGVINQLEDDVENAYNLVESSFSKLWTNASQNAHNLQGKIDIESQKAKIMEQINNTKNYLATNESIHDKVKATEKQIKDVQSQISNLEAGINLESISQQASNALDSLDSKLEFVEQKAGQFMSSFTSFLSSVVSTAPPSEVQAKEPSPPSPNFLNETYGTTRYDADLFKLHTSEDPYLLGCSKDVEAFDVESKTSEISRLLEQYPDTLAKTMNKLVPVKVSYKEFWLRYFDNETSIKSSEKARKELLAKKDGPSNVEEASEKTTQKSDMLDDKKELNEEEEEEFTWDDEDDE